MWKKKHFHEIVSFDSHSKANFLPSPNLKKSFFLKKPIVFFTKKQFRTPLKNSVTSVAFYGKIAMI